jgi:hypothetical protein
LPEPADAGHRKRKFCNDACKQRYYRRHKRIARIVGAPFEPIFQASWELLNQQYERALSELAEEREQGDILRSMLRYYIQRDEEMQVDYQARLKGLGMSDEQIKKYNELWKDQHERFHL